MAGILAMEGADADHIPWGQVRYQHTQAVRAVLAERFAPATANRHLAALRGVLREAYRLGQMSGEDFHRAVDLPGVKGTRLPAGRAVEQGELRTLFRACADDPNRASGIRDAAILAVLYGAGVRRAELVALDLADYEPDSGALTIRSGKGNQDRMAYATNGSKDALNDWVAARGDEAGPLFCPVNKGGNVTI